ncbi:MAG: alpha/beta hydrolase [Caulobacteraceae bacterium]|nr:alpha/beta hydrolase [Caulobacteraceae bacterium]
MTGPNPGGARKRPKGLIGVGWACLQSAALGRTEHAPPAADYPDDVVRRIQFAAGAGLGWKLTAIATPRAKPAPWKIVVVTGAPSWAEYWAPVLAALPQDREMVVVDRPGFGGSEPPVWIGDIRLQALALEPLLEAAPGQKVLLVGQSYGAAIATLMAAANPRKVGGLVLLSAYLGEFGPTASWLVKLGGRLRHVIPRDLRHAVLEVSEQAAQLPHVREALARVKAPLHVIHGDKDDFAPIEIAERLVAEMQLRVTRFARLEGGDHFLNDGPAEQLLEQIEACIPSPPKPVFTGLTLSWPRLEWLKRGRKPSTANTDQAASLTSILPELAPLKSPIKASGAASSPSTMVS